MTLPRPISPSQTDPKSPVDDNLMDSIRENLDYLDTVATSGGVPVYPWNVNGPLRLLPGGMVKRIDMQFLHVQQIFTRVRLAQEMAGYDGKTEIDIRFHANPNTPITGISHQLLSSTTSIAQIAPNIATQSIVRATAQVATQSVGSAKGTINIQSIVYIEGSTWRYNFSTTLDSDYKPGDTVVFAGCANAANNGSFTILETNQNGYPSLTISNALGVAQNSAQGTAELQCWVYSLVNPADVSFVPGEPAIFAAHTDSNNNGTFNIYAVNKAGNNLWIKKASGTTNNTVNGNINVTRWIYAYSASVPVEYEVGEIARFASHTTGANNGDFRIVAKNTSGNNITIVNTAGVAQGASAGNVNPLRWKYSFASDPAAFVDVGHRLIMAGHTNANNNGIFTVVKVNDLTLNNVVIYNPLGVVQASTPGTVTHTRKLVKMAVDNSLIYNQDSYIEMEGTPDGSYRAKKNSLPFKVIEVNRGGGANYNVVIENDQGLEQLTPAGMIAIEAKSIFNLPDGSKPQLTNTLLGNSRLNLLKNDYGSSSFRPDPVPAQTYLGLYILSIQTGDPQNLSVMLT